MPCPSPRGDICPSAVNRQAGSRHRRIETSGPKQCRKRASLPGRLPRSPRPRNRHAPNDSRDETSWPMPLADCAGAARRLTAASTLARLVGTRWNMLADSGVPAMLASRICAVTQRVPYNGPSPLASSSAVVMTLREGNANTLRFSRFNEHSLCARFIGNPLCPPQQIARAEMTVA